jgi:hypothetical protein
MKLKSFKSILFIVVLLFSVPTIAYAWPTVTITSPSNNTKYCTGQTVTVEATVEDGKEPYTWDWSAPGGTPSSGSSPNSFETEYSSAGTKSISVQVTDANSNPSNTDSVTVIILDGLTVFPPTANICVDGTKAFYAWTCVEGEATDVTSSSTFSSTNGSFMILILLSLKLRM